MCPAPHTPAPPAGGGTSSGRAGRCCGRHRLDHIRLLLTHRGQCWSQRLRQLEIPCLCPAPPHAAPPAGGVALVVVVLVAAVAATGSIISGFFSPTGAALCWWRRRLRGWNTLLVSSSSPCPPRRSTSSGRAGRCCGRHRLDHIGFFSPQGNMLVAAAAPPAGDTLLVSSSSTTPHHPQEVALVVVVLVAAVAATGSIISGFFSPTGAAVLVQRRLRRLEIPCLCPAPPRPHHPQGSSTSSGRAGRCCGRHNSIISASSHPQGQQCWCGGSASWRYLALCPAPPPRPPPAGGVALVVVVLVAAVAAWLDPSAFLPTGAAVLVQRLRRLECLLVSSSSTARTTHRRSSTSSGRAGRCCGRHRLDRLRLLLTHRAAVLVQRRLRQLEIPCLSLLHHAAPPAGG